MTGTVGERIHATCHSGTGIALSDDDPEQLAPPQEDSDVALRTGLKRKERHLIGGFYIDGETTDIIVAAGPSEADAGQLWRDRRTTVDDLPRELAALSDEAALENRGAGIDWTVALGGDLALHDVVEIPSSARTLPPSQRLDVCLRETEFGRAESIEESGYRVAHVFAGTRCVTAIASQAALSDLVRTLPVERLHVTTEAGLLLELFRKSAPEMFEPGAPAAMAMLCSHTSFAAVIVDRGEPRLLYQTGLLDQFRDVLVRQPAPASAQPQITDGEFEFEMGGGYSIPNIESRYRREPEIVPSRVESSVYQTAVMTVFKLAIDMYRETYRGESLYPQRLYLTGAAVADHTLLAFFMRHFHEHMAVQDLLSARAVRIPATNDEMRAYGREFAARQSAIGGALGVVAAASSDSMLEFNLEIAEPTIPMTQAERRDSRAAASKRQKAFPTNVVTALVVALGLAVVAVGGRLAYFASVQRDLSEKLASEQARNVVLESVKSEKLALEAKMKHTREILDGVRSMRTRQVLPPQLLSIIEQSLPNGTRLDEVELTAGNVRISGSSDFRENIPKFALALENRRDDFQEVVPTTNQTVVKEVDESGVTGDKLVYTFSIGARYVRNVATAAEQRLAGPQGTPITTTGVRAPESAASPAPAAPAPGSAPIAAAPHP